MSITCSKRGDQAGRVPDTGRLTREISTRDVIEPVAASGFELGLTLRRGRAPERAGIVLGHMA